MELYSLKIRTNKNNNKPSLEPSLEKEKIKNEIKESADASLCRNENLNATEDERCRLQTLPRKENEDKRVPASTKIQCDVTSDNQCHDNGRQDPTCNSGSPTSASDLKRKNNNASSSGRSKMSDVNKSEANFQPSSAESKRTDIIINGNITAETEINPEKKEILCKVTPLCLDKAMSVQMDEMKSNSLLPTAASVSDYFKPLRRLQWQPIDGSITGTIWALMNDKCDSISFSSFANDRTADECWGSRLGSEAKALHQLTAKCDPKGKSAEGYDPLQINMGIFMEDFSKRTVPATDRPSGLQMRSAKLPLRTLPIRSTIGPATSILGPSRLQQVLICVKGLGLSGSKGIMKLSKSFSKLWEMQRSAPFGSMLSSDLAEFRQAIQQGERSERLLAYEDMVLIMDSYPTPVERAAIVKVYMDDKSPLLRANTIHMEIKTKANQIKEETTNEPHGSQYSEDVGGMVKTVKQNCGKQSSGQVETDMSRTCVLSSPADDFLVRWMLNMPLCPESLLCCLYRVKIDLEARRILVAVVDILECAESILMSSEPRGAILRVFESVLSLGNVINKGSIKGSAQGFRVESLLLLKEYKSEDRSRSLLDTVARSIPLDQRERILSEWRNLSVLCKRVADNDIDNLLMDIGVLSNVVISMRTATQKLKTNISRVASSTCIPGMIIPNLDTPDSKDILDLSVLYVQWAEGMISTLRKYHFVATQQLHYACRLLGETDKKSLRRVVRVLGIFFGDLIVSVDPTNKTKIDPKRPELGWTRIERLKKQEEWRKQRENKKKYNTNKTAMKAIDKMKCRTPTASLTRGVTPISMLGTDCSKGGDAAFVSYHQPDTINTSLTTTDTLASNSNAIENDVQNDNNEISVDAISASEILLIRSKSFSEFGRAEKGLAANRIAMSRIGNSNSPQQSEDNGGSTKPGLSLESRLSSVDGGDNLDAGAYAWLDIDAIVEAYIRKHESKANVNPQELLPQQTDNRETQKKIAEEQELLERKKNMFKNIFGGISQKPAPFAETENLQKPKLADSEIPREILNKNEEAMRDEGVIDSGPKIHHDESSEKITRDPSIDISQIDLKVHSDDNLSHFTFISSDNSVSDVHKLSRERSAHLSSHLGIKRYHTAVSMPDCLQESATTTPDSRYDLNNIYSFFDNKLLKEDLKENPSISSLPCDVNSGENTYSDHPPSFLSPLERERFPLSHELLSFRDSSLHCSRCLKTIDKDRGDETLYKCLSLGAVLGSMSHMALCTWLLQTFRQTERMRWFIEQSESNRRESSSCKQDEVDRYYSPTYRDLFQRYTSRYDVSDNQSPSPRSYQRAHNNINDINFDFRSDNELLRIKCPLCRSSLKNYRSDLARHSKEFFGSSFSPACALEGSRSRCLQRSFSHPSAIEMRVADRVGGLLFGRVDIRKSGWGPSGKDPSSGAQSFGRRHGRTLNPVGDGLTKDGEQHLFSHVDRLPASRNRWLPRCFEKRHSQFGSCFYPPTASVMSRFWSRSSESFK